MCGVSATLSNMIFISLSGNFFFFDIYFFKWHVTKRVRRLNLLNVIFEVDCQVVAGKVNHPKEDISELGFITNSCSEILSICTSFSVSFIRRQVNSIASSLRRVMLFTASPIYYYQAPLCASLILNEMS